MYISEISMDLFLLENYPNRFISLYSRQNLNEGTIGDIKRLISDVMKNIGSTLITSGIQTKDVIKEINREISNSKNIILGHLKNGNSFGASEELNVTIYKIWMKLRDFYKSRGIIGKSIILVLFMFILIMTILLLLFTLMNYAIIFVLLAVTVPIMIILLKMVLNFLRLKYKSSTTFPEDELNMTIMKATEKIGIDNKTISYFLSNTSKKITDKLSEDFDKAIGSKSSNGPFTSRAIIMIIKTIKDQNKNQHF